MYDVHAQTGRQTDRERGKHPHTHTPQPCQQHLTHLQPPPSRHPPPHLSRKEKSFGALPRNWTAVEVKEKRPWNRCMRMLCCICAVAFSMPNDGKRERVPGTRGEKDKERGSDDLMLTYKCYRYKSRTLTYTHTQITHTHTHMYIFIYIQVD